MPVAQKPASRRSAIKPTAPKLSRTRPPEHMPVRDWQAQLRVQFGREQPFVLEKLGSEDSVFADYAVSNPQSGRRYQVSIRGTALGSNHCTCADFATNDLGVCKHIAFTLAQIEKRRGGKAALRAGFVQRASEVYLDYAGQRCVRLRLGSECPPKLRGLAGEVFDEADRWALPTSHFDALNGFIEAAARAGHALCCREEALAFMAEHRDAQIRRRVLTEAYPRGAASAGLKKKLLATTLYPYQVEGALFAAEAGRCLIGDEMGLGKTVQALAAARLFMRHFGVERVLVVCPTSLKHQWKREFARFCSIEAQVVGGLRAARQTQYGDAATPCKIANYDTLARDLDLIAAWSPELVIVDEAQRVKNWNTVAAQALRRIDSPYAVVLTGTPLENRLEELISIVQFVDRHRLGPTWKLLHEHQVRDDAGRVVGYRALDRIGATLAPIMLRRRKAEVLQQLPGRIDKNLFVPMTPEQRVHHDENGDTVARIVKRWRRSGYLSEADQRLLTCALQNMRMSCNSTYLLDHQTDHGNKVDELMLVLEDLLADPAAKVVVFSQWLRMHELIARRLSAAGLGHVLFHGGVPSHKRGDLVQRFTEDPACRVFLSTDAGGVGLNLQHAAASVVNMDLPWNPAVLEQRIGRVYRLGQTRGVQVVNFVAQGAIEEGMLSLLAFKKSLFAGVLDGGASDVAMNGTRLSKFMEGVQQATEAARAAAVQAQGEEACAADDRAQAARAQPAPPAGVDGDGSLQADAARAEAAEPSSPDPWAPLIEAGLRTLESLLGAAQGQPENADQKAGLAKWIETDPHSGQRMLRLPMPEPQTVQRAMTALQALLGR